MFPLVKLLKQSDVNDGREIARERERCDDENSVNRTHFELKLGFLIVSSSRTSEI